MTTNVAPFPILVPDGHRGERGYPSPKPNAHPYAIKTTSTALLTRSNSTGHHAHSSHYYVPISPSMSPESKHRYTKSDITSDASPGVAVPFPRPLPVPPSPKAHLSADEEQKLSRRSQNTNATFGPPLSSPVKLDDIPSNPRSWTTAQLSSYLLTALPVPRSVARDIVAFAKDTRLTGRSFLRIHERDLDNIQISDVWRHALLDASRVLRQNVLKGRIWGFDDDADPPGPFSSELYNSSSSSVDLPGSLDTTPSKRSSAGRVKGMVASFERNRRSSMSSASENEGDDEGFDHDAQNRRERRRTVRPTGGDPFCASPVSTDSEQLPEPITPPNPALTVDEPSVQELLAASSMDTHPTSNWGAKAWEERDLLITGGETVKWLGEEQTLIDADPAQRGGKGSGGRAAAGARRTVDDVFSTRPLPIPPKASESLSQHELQQKQEGIVSDVVELTEGNAEHAVIAKLEEGTQTSEDAEAGEVESRLQETRALMEQFRERLEEIERKVAKMEQRDESRPIQTQDTPTDAPAGDEQQSTHDTEHEPARPAPPASTSSGVVEKPKSRELLGAKRADWEWDPLDGGGLSSYVLMVGIGVCAVVLQTMLKRWAGKRP